MKQLHLLLLLLLSIALCGCASYDDVADAFSIDITLTAEGETFGSGITVTVRSNTAATFTAVTDANGTAHFSLPTGIYEVNASSVSSDDYTRHTANGTLQDVVVNAMNQTITLPMTVTIKSLNNPLVIKEIYCGGCQKDDGSGTFHMDKCIILYNNSSAAVSLDSICFGMAEPYNAEASSHYFLNDGILDYADQDWIPAINGIWYFQDGAEIGPYSELVVNVYGAIDNTLTYSQSVNYANPDYYCMYDPTATGPDGRAYNNTFYYPSPAAVIPTSHYLKAVKYGTANAWPLSNTSPAILLFKPQGFTPAEYAGDYSNVVYPESKQDNIVYACLRVPRSWVLDAVEVYNANALANCKKRLTPDLDAGYVAQKSGYSHALCRKIEKTVDGHPVYQDTDNSSNDFYETPVCSIK